MKQFFKAVVVKLLTLEAQILLRRHRPKIVAITGSVGKTTTKDAIYSAIKSQMLSARKNEKSYNSEIGVPLTVLGLPNAWNNPIFWLRNLVDGLLTALFTRKYPDVIIVEAGIDRPGDMDKLTAWLKPDIVVLTRFPTVPVHVEFFSSPMAVVEEKMKLVYAMQDQGVVIYNADDTIIVEQIKQVRQKTIGFSRYLEAEHRVVDDQTVYHDDQPVGTEFSLCHQGVERKVRIMGTLGTHYAYSCVAAMAVADELMLSLDEASTSLATTIVAPGRMRLLAGIKGTTLIDDTYNSSPIACEHALQSLSEVKYAKRRIAILGDMMELGKYSTDEHRRIGEMVVPNVDLLITVGIRARAFAEGALAKGMHESKILQYDDLSKIGRELQPLLKPGDVVLFKASQSVRAEHLVEEVMAEPERAKELLVRQDEAWQSGGRKKSW